MALHHKTGLTSTAALVCERVEGRQWSPFIDNSHVPGTAQAFYMHVLI